jgi:surface antigen
MNFVWKLKYMRMILAGVISVSLINIAPAFAVPIVPHYECVPIARSLSGIQIRGNAHTWWGQAEGHYKRGDTPKRGAVLAFKPHGAMRLGHVAAVSKVIDRRTILVTHSNWSPINGVRGQIERDVKVIDVSEDGDWSQVRVWFAPSQALGTSVWPVHGFIYPEGKAPMQLPGAAAVSKEVVQVSDVRPTGRLSYLGKTLAKLQKH